MHNPWEADWTSVSIDWKGSPSPSVDEYYDRFSEYRNTVHEAFEAFNTKTLREPGRVTLLPSSGSKAGPIDLDVTLPASTSGASDTEDPAISPDQPLGDKHRSRAGDRIRYFGEYELLEEIARGGMGVVYKARQVKLNRIVALKMILSGEPAGGEEVRRFKTEAEAAAKLDHPGIVLIYEIGEHNSQHYFSMGYVEGQSLADRVKDGPLPPRKATEIVKKAAEAVAYAHEKGVIHRDLKPANVLLNKNGEPRVTDFGLAKQVESERDLTRTGAVMGTPSYMPPEQASGNTKEVGPRSDVYSLGAILYCLLTGRPPFQASNNVDTLLQVIQQDPVAPAVLNSRISRDLNTTCLKCLEKEANRRYQTAVELRDDLGRIERGEPIHARPISVLARGWRWCRRNRALANSILAVCTVVLVTAIYMKIASTNHLIDRLIKTEVAKLPFLIEQLDANYLWARPLLKSRLSSVKESGDTRQEIHIHLALARFDAEHADALIEWLGEYNADYLMLVKERIRPYQDRVLARLWHRLKAFSDIVGKPRSGRTYKDLPGGGTRSVWNDLNLSGRNAGLLLAEYAPSSDKWTLAVRDDREYVFFHHLFKRPPVGPTFLHTGPFGE